jgi:hypothetical protein
MTGGFKENYERVKAAKAKANGANNADRKQSNAAPFPFVLARDITLEPKQFLIDGFLGRHEVSAWYGPPDSAKSVVKVHAQACVAAGIEYCGRRVMQGPCLYIAAERGAIIKRRVLAWCREHAATEIPLAVVDHAVDLRTGKIDADRIIATAQELGSRCGQPVVWIAFDTLNRILSGGDENSSKDMGAVMASIDHIHRETAAHVSVIHHVPVDRTDRMRGHSLTLGAVDQSNRITKDGLVRVEVDKANDLVDKPTFAFEITSVTLHSDQETGTATTAPVLVAVPAAAAINRREGRHACPRPCRRQCGPFKRRSKKSVRCRQPRTTFQRASASCRSISGGNMPIRPASAPARSARARRHSSEHRSG